MLSVEEEEEEERRRKCCHFSAVKLSLTLIVAGFRVSPLLGPSTWSIWVITLHSISRVHFSALKCSSSIMPTSKRKLFSTGFRILVDFISSQHPSPNTEPEV